MPNQYQFKKIYTTMLMALALSFSQAVFSADALVCKGCVNNTDLGDNAVSSTKLQDGSISSPKLQDNVISTPKLVNGSVTSPKIKNNSVTAQKIAPGSVNSTHLTPGSVVMSVNGLKDSVTFQAGNGIGINVAGNTLTVSNTQTAQESPLLVLDNTNYSTEIPSNSFVQLNEVIVPSNNSWNTKSNNLYINGGGISGNGTGGMLFYLSNSVISNAHIKDVWFTGEKITLLNCVIEGSVVLSEDSSVQGGVILNVSVPSFKAKIDGAKIVNSTFKSSAIITNSEITDSKLTTYGKLSGNTIKNSDLVVGDFFQSNYCYNCGIQLLSESSIRENIFEQQSPRTDPIITIDETTSGFRANQITNNQFEAHSTPVIIKIQGTGYSNQLIQISGNQFTKGYSAIAYEGGLRTAVIGNTIAPYTTVLGVEDNGFTLRVLDNVQF